MRTFSLAVVGFYVGLSGTVALGNTRVDGLLAALPDDVSLIVSADHQRMAAHKHYDRVVSFLASQNWLRAEFSDLAVGWVPGKTMWRTISFRHEAQGGGTIFTLSPEAPSFAETRKYFEAQKGGVFKQGDYQGHPWFTVLGEDVCLELAEREYVVASMALVRVVADRFDARRKGGATPRTTQAVLRLWQGVREGDPALWGSAMSFEGVRRRLAKDGQKELSEVSALTFQLDGARTVRVRVMLQTASPEETAQLAEAVNEKINARLIARKAMQTLRASRIARKAMFETSGKFAVSDFKLTRLQFGLVLRAAKRIVSAMGDGQSP